MRKVSYSGKYLLQETDPKGHVTFYTYNPKGLLISIIKGDAAVYYAYDAKERKQSTKTYFGYGENDYTLTMLAYDENGNGIEERQEDAFQNVLRRKTLQYDASGNLFKPPSILKRESARPKLPIIILINPRQSLMPTSRASIV